ncbi:MAG: terminase small subunit [Agathobacter sp.]
MAEKKVGGRPPKYKNKEEMQEKIDKYFRECDGKILKNDDGSPFFDKNGNPVIYGAKPPTITGLALALGFTSRQSLLDYEAKKEFLDTITRAKARVEQYAEERLFDKDGANGAKFSLANNFKGWKEKKDVSVEALEKEKNKLDDILGQMRGDD